MLITRESDYALRIIRSLCTGVSMTTGEISDEQQIPRQFTYKIVRKLRKSGILRVARGVDGGCALSADLERLSLYDLIKAVEGDTSVNLCTGHDYSCNWREDHGDCSISCHLSRLQQKLDSELKAMTIASMMRGE